MRAVALLRWLARRVGAGNPHQFAGWFDQRTGMDTQASGKWRLNFSGGRPLSAQQLQLLSRLDGDVVGLHSNGPADLWLALWGDVRVLWPLCRSRFCGVGPMLDDRTWSAVESEFDDEKTYGAALRNFEGELLIAYAYREPLTLRHLTEAVAFYRLHQYLNSIAPSDVDGVGSYRCVHMCMEDAAVRSELDQLGICGLLVSHVVDLELGRMEREPSYRAAVAVDDVAAYARNPRAFVSDDSRWEALRFAWAD
jgi:hypothetical protein